MVRRVKPISTARITAGAMVQATSSLVLPWNCTALSGGRLRKRSTANSSRPSTSTKIMPAVTRIKVNRSAMAAVSPEAGLYMDGVLKETMQPGHPRRAPLACRAT
jgi:hypothetical protein